MLYFPTHSPKDASLDILSGSDRPINRSILVRYGESKSIYKKVIELNLITDNQNTDPYPNLFR